MSSGEGSDAVPIYEYRCNQCGTEFEKLVHAGSAVVCPSCAASRVTRRLSLFGARVQASPSRPAAAPSGGACCGGGCGCR
jgi:putative FmdB family regulatory protein